MCPSVVIVGGGYGGISAAKALDGVADVLLVEQRERFVHNVAALRGLVDPGWAERMFLPYDRLLDHGGVVRDRAVRIDQTGVTLAAGTRMSADYLVLATGSSYPFPAKFGDGESAAAKARLARARSALDSAARVLLLGAGPVGLELAGEVKDAWPDKRVTIVESAKQIVAGPYPDELRAELRRQLDRLGVELILDDQLRQPPESEDASWQTFTVTTTSGQDITADIWFRCHGVRPASDYLAGALRAARGPDGRVHVGDDLRLPGQRHVFAIGDLTTIPEPKMASAAMRHAEVVASNIRAMISGEHSMTTYQPSPPGIVIPLGPSGGATYRVGLGVLNGAETAQIKGAHLMLDRFAELLGLQREPTP